MNNNKITADSIIEEFRQMSEIMTAEKWNRRNRAAAYFNFGQKHIQNCQEIENPDERSAVTNLVMKSLLESRRLRKIFFL